jgi:O-antigen/teichoic acid export membrane protein
MFMGAGVAAVVYLSFLSPWLVSWFTAPAFHEAWTIVGVLSWQSLFYGFYLVASAGIWKAERTSYSMLLMVGAAVLNFLLNWLWVPSLGGMGAAIATSVSFLLWIAASLVVSERLWPVGFPLPLLAAQVALGVGAVAWITVSAMSWVMIGGVHLVVVVLLVSSLDRQRWTALMQRRGALNA